PDRVARAVDDDAGDHGNASRRGLDRRGDEIAKLRGVERMPLARAAAGGETVHALPHQPVHLPLDEIEPDLSIRAERRGHRGNDAVELHGGLLWCQSAEYYRLPSPSQRWRAGSLPLPLCGRGTIHDQTLACPSPAEGEREGEGQLFRVLRRPR